MDTNISIKAQWARRLVRVKLAAELNALAEKAINEPDADYSFVPLPALGHRWTADSLPPDNIYRNDATKHKLLHAQPSDAIHDKLPPRKVCIVGAGVAGLYIAMILDDLKIPNLKYEILESNSRVGGRCYTYNFSDKVHDYYDIGAMRYPQIKTMDRTFDLFKRTGVKLIPYYLSSPACPSLFNDRLLSATPDPYKVSVANGGDVPNNVVDRVSDILGEAFGEYKKTMVQDFKKGFEDLMAVDDYSTREYLKRGGPKADPKAQYNFFAIQWMETQNTSTNLFDQAFSESVIDSFDFDNPTNPKWTCIEGGTTKVIEAMRSKLSTKVETGKRVSGISIDESQEVDGNMSVQVADEAKPREGYSTVFNTAPLGCVGRMDLRGLSLHPSQKDAIRSLHYDDSVKVALRFKEPWWITKCGITQAGVASTDLPLRTCVYPSYNLHDGAKNPAVLLASYTWAQDATRMGSLVDPPTGEELVDLILRNLGRLHAAHITYEEIKALYANEFNAFSWSHDPHSAGAFALFGPGQFSNLYPYLSRPTASGKFHFVGEAASAHHAWIVGALDSAYSAVYKFLHKFQLHDHLALLEKNWGTVGELETGEYGTVHLQIALGAMPKEFKLKV